MNRILEFYGSSGRDHAGRTLDEILAFSDEELEYHHDFIQWLFPLRERSGVNPHAPTLDDATIAAFLEREELRGRLRKSFDRMMRFYADPQWITPHNHNFLRLTRIITCLRTLGLQEEARRLFNLLTVTYESHPSVIGPVTWRFWRNAMES